MSSLESVSWLAHATLLTACVNLVVIVSLILYLLVHNRHNATVRFFCILLTFTTIISLGDSLLANGATLYSSLVLRAKWLGVSLMPAAYLQFSDVMLRTTNVSFPRQRYAAIATYAFGTLLLFLAVSTGWVDNTSDLNLPISYTSLAASYVMYYLFTLSWGIVNLYHLRLRRVTPVTRQRMTWLSIATFILVISVLSPSTLLPPLVAVVRNIGLILMALVAGYNIAYQGSFLPDRIIKRRLIEYFVEAPLLSTVIAALTLTIVSPNSNFGLPRELILFFLIALGIALYQLAVTALKPLAYRTMYGAESEEVIWFRQLDQHLLTDNDLRQLMEKITAAVCDLLQARAAFILVREEKSHLSVLAACGERQAVERSVQACDSALLDFNNWPLNGRTTVIDEHRVLRWKDSWLFPLCAPESDSALGILGIAARVEVPAPTDSECDQVMALAERAGLALHDYRLQNSLFVTLRRMTHELDTLQKLCSVSPPLGVTSPSEMLDIDILDSLEFISWIKAALSHYWGGPNLFHNPLTRLRVVQQALNANDDNMAKAMREVLNRAIEQLKPPGERNFLASEWLLYNVLELRYIERQGASYVANRLALSESDLYRKQRMAIGAVARQVAAMEKRLRSSVSPSNNMREFVSPNAIGHKLSV